MKSLIKGVVIIGIIAAVVCSGKMGGGGGKDKKVPFIDQIFIYQGPSSCLASSNIARYMPI